MLINNDTIIKDPDERLREESADVSLPLSKEDEQLLRDMFEYVKNSTVPELAEKYNLRPAVGISAIQVGVAKKMTAVIVNDVDKNGNPVRYEYMLVNPRIVSKSVQKAYLNSGEGCLSVVQDHEGHVVRSARVTVKAYDALTHSNISIRARGYLAIVLQHELDHFKGVLFYDYIDKKDPDKTVPGALVI